MNVWNEKFTVRHTEVSREGKLRIDAFFDYMQEAAANHATDLGCGLADLETRGMMWVLSRLRLRIYRTPGIGERIAVTTWPSGVDKLFATREFILTAGDEQIAAGSSFWLLLDRARMRPLRVPESLPIPLPDNSGRERVFADLPKLPRRECADPLPLTVTESQIDVNRHMNNARYVARLFDWLAVRLGSAPVVSEIQANFLIGTAPESVLTVSGSETDGVWYIEESVDSVPHFQAEIRL